MNRRFVLVASVGAFTGIPGCSLLDNSTQLILEYTNQTESDIIVFVFLQGNEGIYTDDNIHLSANETYSDIKEIDESGPLSLEISFENTSRGDYEYTIEVEEDTTVEITITESGIEFDEVE